MDFKKEAHQFLMKKGCLSMSQIYAAFDVEKILVEFAEEQEKRKIEQNRVSSTPCRQDSESAIDDMENEMFKPDPDKFRFSIVIDVYDNCAATSFRGEDGETLKKINFHDAVGVLETQKNHMMWHQRESNLAKKMKPKSKNEIL